MAHSFDKNEFGGGDGLGGGAAAADIDHGVGETVDNERGNADLAQAFRSIAGGDGGNGLTHESDFVVRAIVGESGAGEKFGFVAGIDGRTDQAHGFGAVLNDFFSRDCGRTAEDCAHDFGTDLADGFVARGRHEGDERAETTGMFDGHGLCDLAAHGSAEDVRCGDVERV